MKGNTLFECANEIEEPREMESEQRQRLKQPIGRIVNASDSECKITKAAQKAAIFDTITTTIIGSEQPREREREEEKESATNYTDNVRESANLSNGSFSC